MVADLSSQAEVRRLAAEVRRAYPRLDVLVNNAGAMFAPRRESVDGIEMTWALNHLAYFLLTELLLDTLKASAPARVVNVASDAHRMVSGDRLRRPRGEDPYRPSGTTASRSWPTSCSPTSWPGGWRGRG